MPHDTLTQEERETLLVTYEVVGARRIAYDTMLWQAPALGLAAQAFLLTIAYGSDSTLAARVVAGLLAFLVALVSRRLMAAHRHHELGDARRLEQIEDRLGLTELLGIAPHARSAERDPRAERLTAVERACLRLRIASPEARALATSGGRPWMTYSIWYMLQAALAVAGLAAPILGALGVLTPASPGG